ncbi:MAG: interleukin-like EMT inducer domain-containing protein, partial [Candidatus Omnitrophota bacterium]|nr:interleukin-like EMT inducer domain-containing protein [Candidatus Omnitrophota bacterium]
ASESDRLAAFINSVKDGDYVIDAIADEGTWHLSEAAKLAIESIGSSLIRSVGDRQSWVIISRKGAPKGSAIEKVSASSGGPVFVSNYSIEHAYYDENGSPIAFDDFYNTISSTWFSIRPTQMTDEIEIFSSNSDSYASGYIKNYNAQYPDSGFIRLRDCENDIYSDAKMSELASLVNGKKEKAVYYDPTYPTSWTSRDYASRMRNYFEGLGYTVLDADQLRQWMKTRGPDSAVLMCQDIAPSTIVNKYTTECAARDYLDNGGTYVWIHDIPFHYIGYAGDKIYKIGEIGQKKALGIITPVVPRGYNPTDKYKDLMENCVIPEYTLSGNRAPLDKSILTFDFSVNYRDIDWHKIKDKVGYDLKEDTAVVSEYNSDGNLISVAKADRTVSVYKGDKVDFVTDIHGDIIVDYIYDGGGKLIGLNMAQTRRDLDYKIAEVKNEIAKDKAAQLEELAIQKGLIIDKIKGWADAERGRLYGIRSQYEGQLGDLEGRDFWWPWEKRQKSIAMDQIRSAVNQVNDAIRQVNDEEAKQIGLLDGELAGVVRDIDDSAAQALREIDVERLKLLDQLSLEEKRPIIFEYYRDIMGRDPGESEMTYWIDRIKISANKSLDLNALKTYLYNSSEYIERLNKTNKIRGEIDSLLRSYIKKTPQEKETYLSSLKLTLKDTITLSEEDVVKILQWLQDQNLHFGRSAANILGNLLAGKGISYKSEDLVRDAILVDIFTGVINRLSEGEILISAYALKKIASKYNLDLSPVKISFEYLAAMFAKPNPKKVIALLGGNHYVLVTGINTAANKVTYIETSKGSTGESFTVSINDFKDAWQGCYALVQEKPLDQSVILLDYQAQKVRGACFELLFAAIAAIFSSFVVPVIQGVVVAIGAIIGQIVVPVVVAAFNLLVDFVGGLAYGISLLGKALFLGLKFAGLSLFKGFASFFAGNLFGGSISAATIPSAIASFAGKTVAGIAINFGINAGLDALGVDPTITRCISAFVTGGLVGAIGNPAAGFFHFADAMGALAVEGVNSFGAQLNLPKPVIDAFSIAGSSLVNGMFTVGTNMPDLVTKVADKLASEMAYTGVTKAGELLGVDPRISYLAGIGIRSSLQAGLNGMNPQDMFRSVTNGLLGGVTS